MDHADPIDVRVLHEQHGKGVLVRQRGGNPGDMLRLQAGGFGRDATLIGRRHEKHRRRRIHFAGDMDGGLRHRRPIRDQHIDFFIQRVFYQQIHRRKIKAGVAPIDRHTLAFVIAPRFENAVLLR